MEFDGGEPYDPGRIAEGEGDAVSADGEVGGAQNDGEVAVSGLVGRVAAVESENGCGRHRFVLGIATGGEQERQEQEQGTKTGYGDCKVHGLGLRAFPPVSAMGV